MASPFQRYQSGIEASTGNLVQAYGQMAQQTASAISGLGKDIAQGIKTYNENAEKSEAVNAKIQMLGQEYADKIAMYAKDPEIAQSGVLDGLISTSKMFEKAPTMGYNQRAILAQEAESKLKGFGGQLQEMLFLRGREMERVAEEGLNKFAGVTSVTSPAFAASKEFQFDPNKSMSENKAEALRKLNAIRAKNPKMQGSDDDFIQNWLQNSEQTMARVDPSVVPAAVTNDILSQIQSERKIIKGNAEAAKTGLVEDFLARGKTSSRADYNAVTTAAVEALSPKSTATAQGAAQGTGTAPEGIRKPVTTEEAQSAGKRAKALEKDIQVMFGTKGRELTAKEREQKSAMELEIRMLNYTAGQAGGTFEEASAASDITKFNNVKTKINTYADQSELGYLKELKQKIDSGDYISFTDRMKQHYAGNVKRLNEETRRSIFRDPISKGIPEKVIETELDSVDKRRSELDTFVEGLRRIQDLGFTEEGRDILPDKKIAIQDALNARIAKLSQPRQEPAPVTIQKVKEMSGKITGLPTASTTQENKIAPIALGEQVVGSQEVQQRRTVAERQREVADFVTSKMGAIDPTDPERKRRLPVSGFDKFYRSLVPEAEIREYTTPSGVRMMYANGKWEQIKAAEPMSIKDIREANLGLFGTQTENGLVPSEYIDGSGVFLGGIYKGSNNQLEKFEDEMTKLIDARRSIKKLANINDRVGEVFSAEAQGEAQVEVVNLAAMLRTDIVGVGTVSDFEQKLIRTVIKDPTDFFNLESKDRAILIALAQRVDRRMKAISSSKGLTIQIKDGKDGNKYQALREQYLREKGILK
jgi:hypothetical protein